MDRGHGGCADQAENLLGDAAYADGEVDAALHDYGQADLSALVALTCVQRRYEMTQRHHQDCLPLLLSLQEEDGSPYLSFGIVHGM